MVFVIAYVVGRYCVTGNASGGIVVCFLLLQFVLKLVVSGGARLLVLASYSSLECRMNLRFW